MGSCTTKLQKEHSYTQPKHTNSNHQILEELSDGEGDGENMIHNDQYPTQKQHDSSSTNHHSSTSNINNNDTSHITNNDSNNINLSPTYQKLREMGFDSSLAREASSKFPINVNDAMEYAWTKQN